MTEINVRRYISGDEVEVTDLLSSVFNGWPHIDLSDNASSLSFWRWKYLKNPLEKNLTVIAESDGVIAGCFHDVIQNIKIGETTYLAGQGTDLAVHPDYRKMGIYNKMLKYLNSLESKDNFAFHYGVTNVPILVQKYERQKNPSLPHRINDYWSIRNIELHEKNTRKIPFIKKHGFTFLKTINRLKRKSDFIVKDGVSIKRIDRFDDKIDLFWMKLKPYYNFIAERKVDYLNWRYCDYSVNNYVVAQAEENGEVVGYCVYKINKHDAYHVGFIVDLTILPERLDVGYGLLREAVNYFDESGVNIIKWQIHEGHPFEKIASFFGFLNSRAQNHFIYIREVLNIGRDEERLQNSPPEKIHFTYGDYDWI
ncbi:GNAT family N-acetyltransferase [Candidatus Bathyarchaeota archaeon]|nr:GNAT family N-acetyltransferase [Candidatus Bathyarchaeota archaeon]